MHGNGDGGDSDSVNSGDKNCAVSTGGGSDSGRLDGGDGNRSGGGYGGNGGSGGSNGCVKMGSSIHCSSFHQSYCSDSRQSAQAQSEPNQSPLEPIQNTRWPPLPLALEPTCRKFLNVVKKG